MAQSVKDVRQFGRALRIYSTFSLVLISCVSAVFTHEIVINLVFYTMTFAWAVKINQSLVLLLYPPPEAGGYGVSTLAAGLFYLAPMSAAVIGELFGHFFSLFFHSAIKIDDFLAKSYIERHHGVYEPEVRLWMIWISEAFMIAGLTFFGFCLQDLLPWISTAFAWAIYVFRAVNSTKCIF